MKLIFDSRVLVHKNYTGVENYTKYILKALSKVIDIIRVKPSSSNRYFTHFWTHFILPFKKGETLFCPANIAPIFVPKNKKVILTIHDVAFLTYPKSFTNFFRWYYKILVPINIKRADKIITVSSYSKKEIEKFYPFSKGKIEVVYLGYNKEFKKLGLQKRKEILFVGSLNERKNFIGVLKAFINLKRKDYKLIVVGNFSYVFTINNETQEILNMAKESDNIEFKMNILNSELVKLYNQSELFIFPSFYEGFGLPVLEAMACGVPVITSHVSSLPEVGGDAVVYVDPSSVDDIKNKMQMVLNDKKLQDEMIKKGLKRAKEFSWEKSAKEHIKVFDEVSR